MIAGLILAAGAGSRFGPEPKLLADLGGRPVLQHVVTAFCQVGELERVLVVLGANSETIGASVDFGRAEPLLCPEWSQGISASIREGVAALPEAQRIILSLGDMPGVTAAVVRRMLLAPDGARAVYGGSLGHPVVLGRRQLHGVSGLTGDRGARKLISGAALIECGDLGNGRDIDTRDDLEG